MTALSIDGGFGPGAWGFGLARFVQALPDLPNSREASLFPYVIEWWTGLRAYPEPSVEI